jgi:cytochrome c-type biogenesis protein CcmH
VKDGWRIAGISALALLASAGIAAALAFALPEASGPRDGRAWVLDARAKAQANRHLEAAEAYEKGIAASRKVAGDPLVWCELADALGMAQGGVLAGRPAELVRKALALGPTHPRALEMSGSVAYEARDYPRAVAHWEQLLAQLPAGSSAHAELSAAIARTRAQM